MIGSIRFRTPGDGKKRRALQDAMTIVFYIAAAVAVVSTALVIINLQHGPRAALPRRLAAGGGDRLLHAGAPFVAALEVIVYAGAIMVLFVFVVMHAEYRRGRQSDRSGTG